MFQNTGPVTNSLVGGAFVERLVLVLGIAEYVLLPGILTGTTDPPPGSDRYTEADFCLISFIVAGALNVRGNLLKGCGFSKGSV